MVYVGWECPKVSMATRIVVVVVVVVVVERSRMRDVKRKSGSFIGGEE